MATVPGLSSHFIISILAFDRFGTPAPTSYITNGGSGGHERQLTNRQARPAARKHLRRVAVIVSLPNLQSSYAGVFQQTFAARYRPDSGRGIGVHFQLQTVRNLVIVSPS